MRIRAVRLLTRMHDDGGPRATMNPGDKTCQLCAPMLQFGSGGRFRPRPRCLFLPGAWLVFWPDRVSANADSRVEADHTRSVL